MAIDIGANLFIQRFSLMCIGIDLRARPGARVLTHPARLFCSLLPLLYHIVTVFIFMIVYRQKIAEVTWALISLMQMTTAVVKVIILLYKAHKLIALVEEVLRTAQKEHKEAAACQLWQENNRRAQKLAFGYYISGAFSAISFVGLPVLVSVAPMLRGGNFTPIIALNSIPPYDNTQPMYFALEYLMLTANVYFSLGITVGVDTLYFWLVINISSHYQIVRLQLQQIGHAIEMSANNGNNNSWWRHERAWLATLKYHERSLQLAQTFANDFRELILAEVLLSCMLICAIICQYHMNENLRDDIPFLVIFGSMMMLQLIIYCFGGEKIKNEAELISSALYEHLPWYDLPVRAQKTLLLLPVQRAQQPMLLQGYFFTAERELLVWVLRTAASFTALLRTIDDKGDTIA